MSRVVDELVRAGLVQRRANPGTDVALAVLTNAGSRRFRTAAPHYLDGIERHFCSTCVAARRRCWPPHSSASWRRVLQSAVTTQGQGQPINSVRRDADRDTPILLMHPAGRSLPVVVIA